MKKQGFRAQFIGDKAFYIGVITLILPMIVQLGISNFVNLLDNVMVGQLGTEEITSVAIVNQLVFVFNLTIFGGVSGASIFGAQFHGKGDVTGLRHSFRYRIWMAAIVVVVGLLVFLSFGESLIDLFLNEAEGDSGDLMRTMALGKSYLRVTLWGIVPFAFSQCFASTLKDTGETVIPMAASVIAIVVNLSLNYVLIFGKFGAPAMGVVGAGVATAISRYVELAFIATMTIVKRKKFTFMVGAFRSVRVPWKLVKRITITGMPLMINETLWALGNTLISQCYSLRGPSAIAAVSINNTVWQIFSIIMMALGNAIAILVGQMLGANAFDEAKALVKKLMFFNVSVNVVMGLLIVVFAPIIPQVYNTTEMVKELAASLLIVSGIVLPIDAYVHGTYFIIRSGGKTLITFLFDCVFSLAVSFPIAYLLANFTGLSLLWIYACVQGVNVIKVVMGTVLIRSGSWARNVVSES